MKALQRKKQNFLRMGKLKSGEKLKIILKGIKGQQSEFFIRISQKI